jgi:hypothetical protein
MKKIIFRAYVLLFASSLFLISGCQKNGGVENLQTLSFKNTITVEEASTWFANDVVQKEKEMLAQPYSILPQKSPQRLFARMAKLQSKLIWSHAQLFNRNGMQYIVVPITRNTKLRSNEYELERAFVFYKNKDGQMKMNVVEVMSEKGESLNGKSGELIAAAFYNQLTSKNATVPGVNATLFFYNEAYQSLNSYKMKNGVLQEATAVLEVQKNTSGINVEAQVCETFHIIYSQYENGVLVYWEILYTYQDCYNTNGDVETEDPNGGGTSGGGGQGASGNQNSYYIDEDGDQYKIGTGTYTNVAYTINALFGGGNCSITHTMYARFYRTRIDKDKIISCAFVRTDVSGNSLGASSAVATYNVTNLGTNTINVTAGGSIVLPNNDSNPFTNTVAINLGSCAWQINP